MKSCDAIEETFSKFTSRLVCNTSLWATDLSPTNTRYSEMIDLHTGNLASALLSPNSQDIRERLNKKLRSFADGEIPHAADALSALFGILYRCRISNKSPGINNENPRTESKCTWAAGGNRNIPLHRKSMNIALIRSMQRGTLLDMVYRVRKNQVGVDQFVPIHLSSSIFRDIRSELDACRLYLTPIRPALTNPLQWYKPTTLVMGMEGTKWIPTVIVKRSPRPAPRSCKLGIRCRRITFRAKGSCLALSRRECELPRTGKRCGLTAVFYQLEIAFHIPLLQRNHFRAIEVPRSFLEQSYYNRKHRWNTHLFAQVRLPPSSVGKVFVARLYAAHPSNL